MKTGQYKDAQITALGHSGFLIDFPTRQLRFAFDPYDLHTEEEPVDYIFVSHPHFDHCDLNSIKKLLKDGTKVIAPKSCQKELAELTSQTVLIEDEDKHEDKQVTYWGIPAYNINKYRTPTEVFHPKELGGVGFVVEVEAKDGGKNIRFYHAGDTDFTPEMAELKKVDVAFLPISGTFVMTLEEALKATEALEPKLVIPMHFGKLLGSSAEAIRFQNLLRDKMAVMVLTDVSY